MKSVDAYVCTLEKSPDPIPSAAFKIGGAPAFLKDAEWPVCKTCGQKMDFIAQLPLQNPIRFSRRYRMAYVFMCPGKYDERGWLICATYAAGSGANAIILQSDSNRLIPATARGKYSDYLLSLKQVDEPAVDVADYDVDGTLREQVSFQTKIGGVPAWLQNNDTPACPACGGAMRFLGQLSAELDGPLPADTAEWDKYTFLDFGDDGIGYIFLCEKECGPEGAAFLWQTA